MAYTTAAMATGAIIHRAEPEQTIEAWAGGFFLE